MRIVIDIDPVQGKALTREDFTDLSEIITKKVGEVLAKNDLASGFAVNMSNLRLPKMDRLTVERLLDQARQDTLEKLDNMKHEHVEGAKSCLWKGLRDNDTDPKQREYALMDLGAVDAVETLESHLKTAKVFDLVKAEKVAKEVDNFFANFEVNFERVNDA